MADNYIERQQEQYEARKAAWKQAQKYGKKKLTAVRPAESKSHTSTVSKPEDSKRRVFITGGAEGIGKAIGEAFCSPPTARTVASPSPPPWGCCFPATTSITSM